MKPEQRTDGMWIVLDENKKEVAGPFDTVEEAWDWIKENKPKTPRPKV